MSVVSNYNVKRDGEFEDEEKEIFLYPPEPDKPLAADCCGTGCVPCVFDIYDQDMLSWKEKCLDLKYGKRDQEEMRESVLSDLEFRQFQLSDISELTFDTNLYTFTIPGGRTLGLLPGQHILLRCVKAEGGYISRQYTPVSSLNERGNFQVFIKIYQDGGMSQCVRQWAVGTMVDWRGPFGKFIYQANKFTKLYMFAAGTGLAPMVQIIRTILSHEEDETRIRLVYCCKTRTDIIMKSDLDEWRSYWNFSMIYVISRVTSQDDVTTYGEEVRHSRLDEEYLHHELRNFKETEFILSSGTKSFDKDVIKFCKHLNIGEDRIHKF